MYSVGNWLPNHVWNSMYFYQIKFFQKDHPSESLILPEICGIWCHFFFQSLFWHDKSDTYWKIFAIFSKIKFICFNVIDATKLLLNHYRTYILEILNIKKIYSRVDLTNYSLNLLSECIFYEFWNREEDIN